MTLDRKQSKRPVGRPTKLTPQVQKRICAAIKAGNYASVAARAAGITEATFHNWMKAGEGQESGEFFEFFEAVKKAEAEREVTLVKFVKLNALNNWQAAMTMLERLHPDRWGRRDRTTHEITGPGGASLLEPLASALEKARASYRNRKHD
jgi:hypothetical protein